MARLTQVSDAAAGPEAAALFTAIKGKVGMVPNLYCGATIWMRRARQSG